MQGRAMRQANEQVIAMLGETFDIVRGDQTHQAKGSRNDAKRLISFLHDADIQSGDVARGAVSGETFYIERVERDVTEDILTGLTAYYDTDHHRAQRQASFQPSTTITIGTIYNSVLNIESQLEHVTQQIGVLSQADTETRRVLAELIAQLKIELQKAPPELVDDVARVTNRVETVVKEAAAARPDTEHAAASLESLKKAATNLATVLPPVLTISEQIIERVRPLLGL